MEAQDTDWRQNFFRGIEVNWPVFMVVLLSASPREIDSKNISIWFPPRLRGLFSRGLDHVIANMFFIHIGVRDGTPFSVG
jgi:formate/nitrite transporter FocA (FNT family)